MANKSSAIKAARQNVDRRAHNKARVSRLRTFIKKIEDAIATGQGASMVVVNFIAMLELSREALIEITQAEPYAPIYVRLAYSPNQH